MAFFRFKDHTLKLKALALNHVQSTVEESLLKHNITLLFVQRLV